MQLTPVLFCSIGMHTLFSSLMYAAATMEMQQQHSPDLVKDLERRLDTLQSLVLSLNTMTQKQSEQIRELKDDLVRKDHEVQVLQEQLHKHESRITMLNQQVKIQQTLIQKQDRVSNLHQRKTNHQELKIKQLLSQDYNMARGVQHSKTDRNTTDTLHPHYVPKDFTGQAAGNVAFSAYLTQNLYNLGPNDIIPFKGVVLNEGNAYNSNVGVFTAPRDGIYLFSFALEDMETHRLWVRLVVDGTLQTSAIVRPTIPGIMAFNLVIVRVSVGQSVWVAIDPQASNNSIQGTSYIRTSTFSGAFLHP